jgi:hypothetical protein
MAGRRGVPSVPAMNLLTKIFITLAITCGAAWLLKQVVIVASGGADAESPLIAALWGTGMLTFVLAAAAGTALALRRLPTWARVIAAVAAVPASFLVIELVDTVIDAVYKGDNWFATEVPLVLAALVMGALGVQTLSGTRRA